MKNTLIIILIVTFLISSCSTVKEKLSPINSYLKSKIQNNEMVIVIENKINNNFTIDFFKERFITPINLNTIENSTIKNPLLYKENYWLELNKKYRNQNNDEIWLKNELWSQNDFINPKIKLVKEAAFPKPYVFNEYMTDKMDEVIVFSFSCQMFYKNKKYVLFAKAETTSKKQFINPNSIVIMKKKNGKWIIYQEIKSGDYN
jgi:hypothetical protein